MFKKTAESAQNAMVSQRSLDIKMGYNDTNVVFAKQYFNQSEDLVIHEKEYGLSMCGGNKI